MSKTTDFLLGTFCALGIIGTAIGTVICIPVLKDTMQSFKENYDSITETTE